MHIPRATYRIQFTPQFGFKQAKDLVAYLAALGISDLYASPVSKATPGSLHGYDVTDPNRLNPELGTKEEFVLLSLALKEKHMGWLQDIVPNHMAFHPENRMLMDVLEKGDQSEYADFFDMRVRDKPEDKRGPVAIPVLGEPFEQAMDEGKLTLAYCRQKLCVKYVDLLYPVKWESYAEVFRNSRGHSDLDEYLSTLENSEEPTAAKEEALEEIWKLYAQQDAVKKTMDERLGYFNGQNALSERFGPLKAVLAAQYYQLIYWRNDNTQGNYRRFFHLPEFIGLRMEQREVFERTHRMILEFAQKDFFQGVRIDHIDGLYEPRRYLERLRRRAGDLYIIAEKILNMDEQLPPEWPIQGTTGYDFLAHVNGLFCSARAKEPLTHFYQTFTGEQRNFETVLRECKITMMGRFMESDLAYLSRLAAALAAENENAKAPPADRIQEALKEIIAEMDVYRTYIDEEISPPDQRRLETAIDKAVEQAPGCRRELKLLKKLLLTTPANNAAQAETRYFALRFQQFTGPVMAKGLEDTCFYRYNRFISLNEVGGKPERFGVSRQEFERFIGERAWAFAFSMNATSTHDTKRGEDARARLNVLTEMPDLWRQAVERWAAQNESLKRRIGSDYAPSKNEEYFLYQTMVGSFPFGKDEEVNFFERLKGTAVKAAREAGVHTNWTDPNAEYEDSLKAFVSAMTRPGSDFLADFRTFHKQIAYYGIFNSLSQTLIKMTAPGVPDFYQGSELWNLSMVDPDNRREVDYAIRQQMLQTIRTGAGSDTTALLKELLQSMEDGRVKMYLIWKTLHLRAGFGDLFERGDYVPLEVRGSLSEHLIAFARVAGGRAAVTVVPRFVSRLIEPPEQPLGDVWEDTEVVLPIREAAAWYDCFTENRIDAERTVRAANLLAIFPAACIVSVPEYHLKAMV